MYLPHKNHKTIVDVLANLKTNYKKTYQVVFCGNDIGYLENILLNIQKRRMCTNR